MGNGSGKQRVPSSGAALPPELPSLKIALIGDPGVGKTSVLLRYLRNQFSPMYIPTKKVAIENVVRKLNVPANTVVSLTLWDIPGREDMDIHKSYFRNLDAAIVVVDMTNSVTLDMANVWKQTVLNKLTRTVPDEENGGNGATKDVPVDPVNFPVLLLGNKFDIIEEEMLTDFANRQVSVSMDVTKVTDLKHDSVDHLESIAEQHNFVGSLMVSAKQTDNSVTMAIQSLVRNILEKKDIPRKWKAVPDKPKPPKKEKPFIYNKLEKVDIEKVFGRYEYNKLELVDVATYDDIITKADLLLKETVVLRHYYTVSLVRFKDTCIKAEIVTKTDSSFEDCIIGLKREVKEGSSLKICEDEDFFRLELVLDNDDIKVKQLKVWKKAFRCFHNEVAAVAKAILKEGPAIGNALEKYDVALEKILKHNEATQTQVNQMEDENKQDDVTFTNKIIRNRAKVQHAMEEMKTSIKDVEQTGKKISNVDHW